MGVRLEKLELSVKQHLLIMKFLLFLLAVASAQEEFREDTAEGKGLGINAGISLNLGSSPSKPPAAAEPHTDYGQWETVPSEGYSAVPVPAGASSYNPVSSPVQQGGVPTYNYPNPSYSTLPVYSNAPLQAAQSVDTYGAPSAPLQPVQPYGAPAAPVQSVYTVESGQPVYVNQPPQYDTRNYIPPGNYQVATSSAGLFNTHNLFIASVGALSVWFLVAVVSRVVVPLLSASWMASALASVFGSVLKDTEVMVEGRSLAQVSSVARVVFDAIDNYNQLNE